MECKLSVPMVDSLNKCDIVFTATNSAANYHKGIIEPPIYTLPGGMNPEMFPFRNRDFSENIFTFLHAGAQWRKGTDIACAAFQNAFYNEENVRLLILSPGETPMYLELKEEYKYNKKIIFESKVISDRNLVAHEYYNRGHCLVYPSILEGWGRCLAEAMCTGMPCIISKTSAMIEQCPSNINWWVDCVCDQSTGFYIPDVTNLEDCMRNAFCDDEKCKRFGKMSSLFAREYLTWDIGVRYAIRILEDTYC